jgi:hypothetical protein
MTFLAEHPVKTVPPKFVRFFRYDVANRWRLDMEGVSLLSGDWNELVSLLTSAHGFARRRAEAEADDFFYTFIERVGIAIDIDTGSNPASLIPDPKTRIAAA